MECLNPGGHSTRFRKPLQVPLVVRSDPLSFALVAGREPVSHLLEGRALGDGPKPATDLRVGRRPAQQVMVQAGKPGAHVASVKGDIFNRSSKGGLQALVG